MARWRRGCIILTSACLVVLLAACSLTIAGIRTQAIRLPPVLVNNEFVWVGDICRDNRRRGARIRCPPVYSVSLVVQGTRQTYTLLHIPLAPLPQQGT
jgi:hypothetical protein